MKLLFSLLLTLTLPLLIYSSTACKHSRDYGNGATVCVCSLLRGSQSSSCSDDLNLGPIPQDPGVVTAFETSKIGKRFAPRELQFTRQKTDINSSSARASVSIKVNSNVAFQKIVGFGGAFTDSAGINIASLPTLLQKQLISDYFSVERGIGYSLGRVPIGGTDFSPRPYSYDDHNQGDETLRHFALQPEDYHYKLPYLHQAIKESPYQLKLFSTCWSPPAWMKTNGQLNQGGLLKGSPGGKHYKLFAQYLVKFLTEYTKQNITFWGLTVENEPQMGFYPNYTFNSLGLNDTLERDFVKLDLGPTLATSGFGPDKLKLMIFDDDLVSMNGKSNIESFTDTVLQDPEASKYISGIGYHWYARNADKEMLNRLAKKYPSKFLLPTEASEMWHGAKVHVRLGDWATFDRYAVDIIEDLNRHAVGYTDWNLALNPIGGPSWASNFLDSPVIINATAGEYYRQPFFYALGHFSKFLVPGSVRIDAKVASESSNLTHNKTAQLLTSAFMTPSNATVLNVLNRNAFPVALQVHDPRLGFLATLLSANSLETFIWHT